MISERKRCKKRDRKDNVKREEVIEEGLNRHDLKM